MAPGEHAGAKLLRKHFVPHQKIEHRAPKALGKERSRHARQCDKATVGKKRPVGSKHVQRASQALPGVHLNPRALQCLIRPSAFIASRTFGLAATRSTNAASFGHFARPIPVGTAQLDTTNR